MLAKNYMAKQVKKASQKKRGRPATGRGSTIGVRMHEYSLARIDSWRLGQPDVLTRPEAIRRLVENGLATAGAEIESGERSDARPRPKSSA